MNAYRCFFPLAVFVALPFLFFSPTHLSNLFYCFILSFLYILLASERPSLSLGELNANMRYTSMYIYLKERMSTLQATYWIREAELSHIHILGLRHGVCLFTIGYGIGPNNVLKRKYALWLLFSIQSSKGCYYCNKSKPIV